MSILDDNSRPIERKDLKDYGFKYYSHDQMWELRVLVKTDSIDTYATWAIRYWEKGAKFNGDRLRRSKMNIRIFDLEKFETEYNRSRAKLDKSKTWKQLKYFQDRLSKMTPPSTTQTIRSADVDDLHTAVGIFINKPFAICKP